ncbi:unnamed protein product [Sympodiomycopsis kandeliae]
MTTNGSTMVGHQTQPQPQPQPQLPQQGQPNGNGSSSAAAAPPNFPPHVLQMMASMSREKVQQLLGRMTQLKNEGQTESNNQEYAGLVRLFRTFQQYQAFRQQQMAAAMQAKESQANGISSSGPTSSTSAPSSSGAPPQQQQQPQAAPQQAQASGSSATPVDAPPSASTTTQPQSNGTPSAAGPQASTPGAPGSNDSPSTQPSGAPAAFTPDQLSALKAQIMAFKLISRNMPIPAEIQIAIFGEAKYAKEMAAKMQPLRDLGEPGKVAAPAMSLHSAAEAAKTADATEDSTQEAAAEAPKQIVRPPSPKHNPESEIYPYNAYKQPWSYLSKPALGPQHLSLAKQQRLLVPSLMPRGLDPQILYDERNRFIDARIEQRKRELEKIPATISELPTVGSLKAEEAEEDENSANLFDGYIESKSSLQLDNAKIKTLIELKSLDLRHLQRSVREKLVGGFSYTTSLALDRAGYKRWKKTTLRDARKTEQAERDNRQLRERQAKQGHTDYLSEICNHGKELQKAHSAAYAHAQRMGKAMQRFHVETEKEEQRRVERLAKERLNALRADDEEAYLKLIDTAKDTRITHLIRQTDAYLEGLAQSIQAQQNDDVHADTIAAERAAGLDANHEIGAVVDETMFGAQKQDDDDDKSKMDYYSVAHRVTERISEQPTILVGGKLKEYQIKGLQWMVSLYNNRLNGILADEMGLGKTIQTISLITFLIEHKRQHGPYLVIVPLSTLTNWVNEFNKWAPSVSVLTYKGTPNVRKAAAARIRASDFQVLLTTYEYIIKDKNLLGKIRWVHMIIDEGHRMKNTQSKLTQTLTQAYVSRYRLLLTGTPLQNNLPELWALLNFVLPRIFNSVKSFDEWFNSPFAQAGAGDNSMQLNEEEALLIIKRLHKVLRPFLLRRLKKDVESELPDKVEKVIKCKMSALQAKLYQQMKKHKMIISGDDSISAKGKPQGIRGLQNAIMQLRKICNHPYVFEQVEMAMNPSKGNGPDLYRVAGKFELLDRLMPKLKATGHRILIFFQMTAIMDIMEDFLRFRNYGYLRLDGNTKPDERSRMLHEFNAPNSPYFVFILSTRAGGLGLNLQTADTVIIYDSDWNPHQDLQAQDRAHRIGQKMEVRILRLITEKSVEEQILARAQFKLEIDGKVIQAGKFDNQATAEEREDLLRSMLEDDNDEEGEDEEEGDLNDEELNEILARSEDEKVKFKEMDQERERQELEDWQSMGYKGKPERLVSEKELPALYQRDFDAEMLEAAVEEEPAVRKRAVVHYDDGLTEDQFLRALEDEDVDLTDVVEKKRERAEKRRAKQLATQTNTPSQDGTPEPSSAPRKKGKGKNRLADDEDGDDSSFGGPGRKRKRTNAHSPAPSVDSQADVSTGRSGGGAGGKRRKGADDPVRQRVNSVLMQCYRAADACVDDTGRKRSMMFQDIPKKTDYPDYHVIIQKPISLRQIKRRIDNRTYRSVQECKDDIHLMAKNAKTYNEEGSWVYVDAVELQGAFDKMYDQLVSGSGLPGADGEEDEDGEPAVNGSRGDGDEEEEEGEYAAPRAPSRPSGGMKIKLKRRSEVMDDDS